MARTRKQRLAEYLSKTTPDTLSATRLMKYSGEQNLGVQVRTLNSEGSFVIKLSSSDPWIDPLEWLHNYRVSVKERYETAAEQYHSLFPQEDNGVVSTGAGSKDSAEGEYKAKYEFILHKLNLVVSDGVIGVPDNDTTRKVLNTVLRSWPRAQKPESILNQTLGLMLRPVVAIDKTLYQDVQDICKERVESASET